MYPKLSRVLFIAILILLFQINFATAQAIPKSIQQGGNESTIKERKNAWTVGIAGGLIDGTYMRFADELAKVLDDGDNLRILPGVLEFHLEDDWVQVGTGLLFIALGLLKRVPEKRKLRDAAVQPDELSPNRA